MLLARDATKFQQTARPAWVEQWLSSREERAEKDKQKAERAESEKAPVADPQAAAKREAARLQRMLAGADELETWLADRIRQGLAALPGQRDAFEQMAVRMVDAQMPGLAFRLRSLERLVGRDPQRHGPWHSPVLAGLGQLQWMVDGLRRIASLSEPVQTDLRLALGQTMDRTEVLATGHLLRDDWQVLGQAMDEDDKIWTRRVWFQGATHGRRAVLIEHGHGTRRSEHSFIMGSCLHAELAFYPGNAPQRVVLCGEPAASLPSAAGVSSRSLSSPMISEAFDQLGQSLARNPWFWPQSLHFGNASLQQSDTGWYLQGPQQECIPLRLSDAAGQLLLAVTGAHPVSWFGEWDGIELRPLTAWGSAGLWTEEAVRS